MRVTTKNKLGWGLILPWILLSLACGPGPKKSDKTEIAIGAVIDLTGNNSDPLWVDALTLAESHVNAALEGTALSDARFKIHISDSSNEPEVAVQRAQQLLKESKIVALISDSSQNDIAINHTYYDDDPSNDLNVPIQCSGCTSGSINNPTAVDSADPINQATLRNEKKWNFRSIMSTKLISKVVARMWADTMDGDHNTDGKRKIAIYHSDEAFGSATAKDLTTFARELHPDVAIEKVIHPRDADPSAYAWGTDLDALVDTLSEDGQSVDGVPDLIVVVTFAQYYIPIIRTYKLAGYNVPLIHVHTFRIGSTVSDLKQLANEQQGVSHVLLDNGPSGEVFAQEFERATGVPPVYRTSIYYDNALTLMLAAAAVALKTGDPGNISGEQVRDELLKLQDPEGEVVRTGPTEIARAIGLLGEGKAINYEGASGSLDYDENLNVRNKLALYKVQQEQFIDVKVFDCVSNDDCLPLP